MTKRCKHPGCGSYAFNLRDIDQCDLCDVHYYKAALDAKNTAIDRLESHLKAGATISHQEGLCCLFDSSGEGIAEGATLRAMVLNILDC
jgi:hypothetical protein